MLFFLAMIVQKLPMSEDPFVYDALQVCSHLQNETIPSTVAKTALANLAFRTGKMVTRSSVAIQATTRIADAATGAAERTGARRRRDSASDSRSSKKILKDKMHLPLSAGQGGDGFRFRRRSNRLRSLRRSADAAAILSPTIMAAASARQAEHVQSMVH